jgi:REP element-mobilizing transposase RayT
MYHIVCPAKYRRVVISEEVDKTLKETCEEISKRYEIIFLEIGAEGITYIFWFNRCHNIVRQR